MTRALKASDLDNFRIFCGIGMHDFKYFDELSDKAKELVKEVMDENYEKNGLVTPVETIIRNHITRPPVYPIRRVVGPVSMAKIKVRADDGDKLFYLFGDIHYPREKCPVGERSVLKKGKVPLFGVELLKHLKTLDKIVDLFFEEAHQEKTEKMEAGGGIEGIEGIEVGDNMIKVLSKASTNCLYLNETKENPCGIKNVRFQLSDPRDLSGSIINSIFQLGSAVVLYKEKRGRELFEDVSNIFEFNDKVKKSNGDVIIPLREDVAIRRIQKQIDNVQNRKYNNELNRLLDLSLTKFSEEIDKILKFTERIGSTKLYKGLKIRYDIETAAKKEDEEEEGASLKTEDKVMLKVWDEYVMFCYKLVEVAMLDDVLNLYFLGRCFRIFNSPKRGFPIDPCRNIVAVFGDVHNESIEKILLGSVFNGELQQPIIRQDVILHRPVGYQCMDLNIRLYSMF